MVPLNELIEGGFLRFDPIAQEDFPSGQRGSNLPIKPWCRRAKELERFRAKHALGLDPGVDTGSREENASKQDSRASVLIQSEPKML
jgi:hypothetical protein